jgi:hypothetical protein
MATLTVTIREEIVLNESDHGSECVTDITSVTQMFERVIDCTIAEMTLLSFDTAAGGGTFVDAGLKYVRITNTDATNFVTLRVLGNSEEYFVKLEPKGSFVLFNDKMDANASGSASATLANIDDIKGAADTATCQLAIFAAA